MAWVAWVVRSHWRMVPRKEKAILEPFATNLSKLAEGRWKMPEAVVVRLQTWQVL